jgi:hypothetical protein
MIKDPRNRSHIEAGSEGNRSLQPTLNTTVSYLLDL